MGCKGSLVRIESPRPIYSMTYAIMDDRVFNQFSTVLQNLE